MAEALLKRYGGDAFDAYSAGLQPAGINPFTIQAMEEIGIDMSLHSSKSVSQYMGKVHFGYMITVCSNAEKKCPAVFPGMGKRMHWPFEDPAALKGSDQDKLAKFRQVRDQIEKQIKAWLSEVQHAD